MSGLGPVDHHSVLTFFGIQAHSRIKSVHVFETGSFSNSSAPVRSELAVALTFFIWLVFLFCFFLYRLWSRLINGRLYSFNYSHIASYWEQHCVYSVVCVLIKKPQKSYSFRNRKNKQKNISNLPMTADSKYGRCLQLYEGKHEGHMFWFFFLQNI